MGEKLSKLKKRSGASYRSKRDNPLDLFIDRCLGKNLLPEALRKLPSLVIHVHDDHFAPDEQDHIWLPKVAAKGWVILTKDKDIRHRKLELDAVLSNDAYLLTFGHGDYTAQEMAEAFRLAFPKIRRAIAGYFPPLVARISKGGDFQTL
jgi:predicted nuclease of predicted toxin-antitoxin system